jgi:hypothetical protein
MTHLVSAGVRLCEQAHAGSLGCRHAVEGHAATGIHNKQHQGTWGEGAGGQVRGGGVETGVKEG